MKPPITLGPQKTTATCPPTNPAPFHCQTMERNVLHEPHGPAWILARAIGTAMKIALALVLSMSISAVAQTVKQALPDAPSTTLNVQNSSLAAVLPFSSSLEGSMIAPAPPPPVPERRAPRFTASKLNRGLVVTEFSARFMDGLTTRIDLTDPCRCHKESSEFFGLPLQPVMSTTPGAMAYSLGVAAAYTFAANWAWRQGYKHPRHLRLWHAASRLMLVGDSTMEVFAVSNNLYLGSTAR